MLLLFKGIGRVVAVKHARDRSADLEVRRLGNYSFLAHDNAITAQKDIVLRRARNNIVAEEVLNVCLAGF